MGHDSVAFKWHAEKVAANVTYEVKKKQNSVGIRIRVGADSTNTRILNMTYWADNIKFIKDILDSKYKKIEDGLTDVSF